MPHKIKWLVEGRVIYSCASDDITPEEARIVSQTYINMIRSSTHKPVHILEDGRNSIYSHLDCADPAYDFLREAGTGCVAFITDDFLLASVGQVASRQSHAKYSTFQQPGDALAFLQKQDASVDWSTVNWIP